MFTRRRTGHEFPRFFTGPVQFRENLRGFFAGVLAFGLCFCRAEYIDDVALRISFSRFIGHIHIAFRFVKRVRGVIHRDILDPLANAPSAVSAADHLPSSAPVLTSKTATPPVACT